MMVHDVCWGGGWKAEAAAAAFTDKRDQRKCAPVPGCPGAQQGVAGGQDMSVAGTCLLYLHPHKTGYPLALTTTIVYHPGDRRTGLLLY